MNKILIKFALCFAIMSLASVAGLAQGRGRGNGNGRRFDVFADRDYRGNRRRNQDWKCGKFVNCHDARDGRWDRSTRATRARRNGMLSATSSNVGDRRYRMTDYWRRRHLSTTTYRRWHER
jgi:hypothetical protein